MTCFLLFPPREPGEPRRVVTVHAPHELAMPRVGRVEALRDTDLESWKRGGSSEGDPVVVGGGAAGCRVVEVRPSPVLSRMARSWVDADRVAVRSVCLDRQAGLRDTVAVARVFSTLMPRSTREDSLKCSVLDVALRGARAYLLPSS